MLPNADYFLCVVIGSVVAGGKLEVMQFYFQEEKHTQAIKILTDNNIMNVLLLLLFLFCHHCVNPWASLSQPLSHLLGDVWEPWPARVFLFSWVKKQIHPLHSSRQHGGAALLTWPDLPPFCFAAIYQGGDRHGASEVGMMPLHSKHSLILFSDSLSQNPNLTVPGVWGFILEESGVGETIKTSGEGMVLKQLPQERRPSETLLINKIWDLRRCRNVKQWTWSKALLPEAH